MENPFKRLAESPMAKTLVVAGMLHAHVVPQVREAEMRAAKTVRVEVRNAIRRLHRDEAAAEGLKHRLSEQLATNPEGVRLKHAFLKSECYERFSPEACAAAERELDRRLASLREGGKEKDAHARLTDIVTAFNGGYAETRAMLTDLLVENEGNCEARAKGRAIAVQELFPRAKIWTQQYDGHIVAVAEVDGVSYALEGDVRPMASEDWAGTVKAPVWKLLEEYATGKPPAAIAPEPGAFPDVQATSPITDAILKPLRSTKPLRKYGDAGQRAAERRAEPPRRTVEVDLADATWAHGEKAPEFTVQQAAARRADAEHMAETRAPEASVTLDITDVRNPSVEVVRELTSWTLPNIGLDVLAVGDVSGYSAEALERLFHADHVTLISFKTNAGIPSRVKKLMREWNQKGTCPFEGMLEFRKTECDADVCQQFECMKGRCFMSNVGMTRRKGAPPAGDPAGELDRLLKEDWVNE